MSDQDFFFDEDDEATAPSAKEAPKPSAKGGASGATRSAARPAASSSPAFFEQSVSMMVAALMAVIGLLVGVIVGFVIAPGGTTATSVGSPAGSTTVAPQLSPEQMQSGDLPAGHPPVGDMGGGEATGTPSQEATGTE